MQSRDAADEPELSSIEQVLDRMEELADQSDEVSVGDVVEAAGARAFAPLILLPGLVMLAPGIGDIPGVPVLMGLLVILVLVQTLIGRRDIWLPRWLSERSVRAERIRKTIGWLRKPGRFIDRWTGPRHTWAARHGGFVVAAIACILIAMATPIMEVVPFSANLAGTVITAFGLALLARDGLVALFAMAVAAGTGALIVYHLFF